MSSSRARPRARAAAFFGALAVLGDPGRRRRSRSTLNGVELLQSLYFAVPVAAVLALIGADRLPGGRGLAQARSVYAGSGRWGARRLAWAGVYRAVTGGIALGVYGGSVAAAE